MGPLREIVLDTETTGLDPADGHRVVEIGCIELVNHIPNGRVWHQYFNPERDMPTAAFNVHGLSEEFLREKPLFGELAEDFLDFIDGARLVIHNASFDSGFLNAELDRLGLPSLAGGLIVDTLALARRKHPGAPNSLDALCKRYAIDNSARTRHGALLDAELLAEVYLELIGGRQTRLSLVSADAGPQQSIVEAVDIAPRPEPLPGRLSDDDRAGHRRAVKALGANAIWTRYENID